MKWGVVPLLCGRIGVAVIIVGCAWGYPRYALYREGVTTQGHVVEIRADWREDDKGKMGAYHNPVVEFRSSVEKRHPLHRRQYCKKVIEHLDEDEPDKDFRRSAAATRSV